MLYNIKICDFCTVTKFVMAQNTTFQDYIRMLLGLPAPTIHYTLTQYMEHNPSDTLVPLFVCLAELELWAMEHIAVVQQTFCRFVLVFAFAACRQPKWFQMLIDALNNEISTCAVEIEREVQQWVNADPLHNKLATISVGKQLMHYLNSRPARVMLERIDAFISCGVEVWQNTLGAEHFNDSDFVHILAHIADKHKCGIGQYTQKLITITMGFVFADHGLVYNDIAMGSGAKEGLKLTGFPTISSLTAHMNNNNELVNALKANAQALQRTHTNINTRFFPGSFDVAMMQVHLCQYWKFTRWLSKKHKAKQRMAAPESPSALVAYESDKENEFDDSFVTPNGMKTLF